MKPLTFLVLVMFVCSICFAAANDCVFIRGDFDGDGDVDTTDLTKLGEYLYQAGADPTDTLDAADADDDGDIDAADWTLLSNWLVYGSPYPSPSPPFAYACIDGFTTKDNLDPECGTNFLLDYTHNLTKDGTRGINAYASNSITTHAKWGGSTSSLTWETAIENALCYDDEAAGGARYTFVQDIGTHAGITYGELKGLSAGPNCDWYVGWTFRTQAEFTMSDTCSKCPDEFYNTNEFWVADDEVSGWEIHLGVTAEGTSYDIDPSNTDDQWFQTSGSDPYLKHAAVYQTFDEGWGGCDCDDAEDPEMIAICLDAKYGGDVLDEAADDFRDFYDMTDPLTRACTEYADETYVIGWIESVTIYWDVDDIVNALPGTLDFDDTITFDEIEVGDIWLHLIISEYDGDHRPLFKDNYIFHTMQTQTLAIVADGCDND